MSDNIAKKNDAEEELVFEGIAYTAINLPDSGQVQIHPYISSGAMDAYGSVTDDPKAAFQAMFAASREDKEKTAPTLTEGDAEVIARLYAEKEEFLDRYTAFRATNSPFDAFGQAIKESYLWRHRIESQRQIEAMIEKQVRIFERLSAVPRGFEATFENLNRQIATISRFALPDFRVRDLSALVETRSLALQVTSVTAQMDLFAFDRVTRTLEDGLRRWTEFTRGMAKFPDFTALFRDHTRYLEELQTRTLAAESLFKSHAVVFSSFERLAENLRLPDVSFLETLTAAQNAIVGSDAMVRSVGQYFQRHALPRPSVEPPALLPSEVKRAFKAEAEIEHAADESEALVHTTTGRLILVGNDALVSLRRVMGEVVDERLGPLGPFVERLRLLSDPKSFHDILSAFGRHLQRDHWKSLWAEVGTKFKTRPEEIAQSLLAMFLQGHVGGFAFVGRELRNGDGFVDVLVNFLGTDYVVEVKIVGRSWSIGSAKDGLDQLDAYVQNYNAASAYLLVFDGRNTEKGEQLASEYLLKSGATAHVIVIRSYFEAPSGRK